MEAKPVRHFFYSAVIANSPPDYFTPLMTRMRTLTGIEYKKITTAATMMIVIRIPMIIHL